jgi:hypothetical protein
MNEEEFDALRPWLPFGVQDAMRADVQARRCTALSIALWGKTSDGLQRQLLAAYPEIPSGFDSADFRDLQKSLRTLTAFVGSPKLPRLAAIWALCSPSILVGTQCLTPLEARCEIVRRAIEYLENR